MIISETFEMDKPKNVTGQAGLSFDWMSTGQMILTFSTPAVMVDRINTLYDDLVAERKLPLHTDALAGKIKDEYAVYFDDDDSETENCNFLPDDIHEWIKNRIHQYLNFTGTKYKGIKTYSAWINDYKAKEYNPLHNHSGRLRKYIKDEKGAVEYEKHEPGLIGMMALKMPNDMGEEITNNDEPKNGYTDFLVNAPGRQFCPDRFSMLFRVGQFIVFPYDMLHIVYPHFNENETRRTFPTNIDVFLPDENY